MLSDKLLELFKKYVELDTSLPSGENYMAAVKLIEAYISPLGFKTRIVEIPENIAGAKNRFNLIAEKFIANDLQTVIIYNHIDTVPADYKDAFTFKIQNGRVHGRGAADQKGGTIAVLSALENLVGKKLRFNIIFLLTTDEENSQKEQLKFLSTKINIPKDTVVFDPDTEAGGVSMGNLSLMQFTLRIIGKSCHSAMSHLGINAIEQAELFLTFFRNIKKEYENNKSKYKPLPEFKTKYVCSRCNVNMITGGIATNVVPDKCDVSVDCRYIPENDLEKEKNKLLKRIKIYADKHFIKYEIRDLFTIEGNYTDHPLADELNEIYYKIVGEKGKYLVMGSTDASEWTKKLKLPHFGIGVIRVDSNIHGVNENCSLKDIENLSLTLQRFLEK